MAVLGINDSHDSGSSIVYNGEILAAVNEERFTKKKNDVGFPYGSIKYSISSTEDEIDAVALAWIGGNALVSRVLPSWDRKRRGLWRRELPKPSRPSLHLGNFVYRIMQNQNPKFFWKAVGSTIGKNVTKKRLAHVDKDIARKSIYVVEHHMAHAASAYYTSGFREALIITLDGAGDGLSGTVSIGDNGEIKRLASFKASASLGIMYGAAAMACDMRFNEDEGKLMSLAAYSYPSSIDALKDICVYDPERKTFVSKKGTRSEMLLAEYMKDHILSKTDRESFAYAVQKHAERQVYNLVKQWVAETGIHNIAAAGGFFSNVIVNMMIEHMPEVKNFFVFPHMGDGGLSVGSAAFLDFMLNGKSERKQIDNAYFGPSYSNEQILAELKKKTTKGLKYTEISDPSGNAADIIADRGEVLLWFQGRMEYGPRALGDRSVLTMPNNDESRGILNLVIKHRPYYQPFASSILEEDAKKMFADYKYPNRFMTTANNIKKEYQKDLVAASHIDHTTRPQVVNDGENQLYTDLIKRVKKKTGIGAVVNTSFNLHRRPIVLDPEDAIWTIKNTGARKLIMGNYLIEKID